LSVNIDYEPPSRAQDQPRRRSRRGLAAAVVVGVAVLVLALLTHDKTKETASAAEPDGPGAPPAVAAGLARGAASSTGSTATRLVSGKPRGFPHTEVGAIEAATSYMATAYDLMRMPKPARAAYVKDVTGQTGDTGERAAAAFRARYYLNEQGQPVGPATGQLVPNVRFTSACYPALGAYKIEEASTDKVRVQAWFPCVAGTIPTQGVPNLEVIWTQGIGELTWKGADWVATGGSRPQALIKPVNSNQVALPFAQRAQLLGPGWTLYSDASETLPADLAELGELR
jgi:hypothetical protein